VDWIRLAQDRDRWRDAVSAVMNLRVLAPRSQLVSKLFDNAKSTAEAIVFTSDICHYLESNRLSQ
jgi:hypothetical protein